MVLHRAFDCGIVKIFLPNIDSSTIGPLHALADTYPNRLVPLMGLHPTHVKENYKEEIDIISQQLSKYAYKGIGEIGIDLYHDRSYLVQQIEAFEKQLEMALKLDLPVVIHARDSFFEILDVIKQERFKHLTGIFHAFTGDLDLARKITSLDFMLGIGGILTFKNSNLSETIKAINIEHIVLETDSPYLAPVPFRGKRNESSYLIYIVRRLAEIKNLTPDEVANITSQNAMKVFKLT
jgi:TatD DNase family protein